MLIENVLAFLDIPFFLYASRSSRDLCESALVALAFLSASRHRPWRCSALVCALPSGNMLAEAMRRSGGVGAMGSQAQGYACLRRQQAPPCPKRVCSTAVACEASSIQPRCAGGAGPAGSRVATGGAVEGSPLWNDPKSEMPIRVVQTIR